MTTVRSRHGYCGTLALVLTSALSFCNPPVMPGAQATVFAAVEARGSFCHTVSGEYNVWLNAKAPLMAGFCAERAARGLDCCGAPTK